jgi:hypothetical protein
MIQASLNPKRPGGRRRRLLQIRQLPVAPYLRWLGRLQSTAQQLGLIPKGIKTTRQIQSIIKWALQY